VLIKFTGDDSVTDHQPETLLLKQPTVSATEIAFVYAGELWIADLDGSRPRRLTAQKGRKLSPQFSPDGAWIAFSGNYDGNLSVYVVSREGGEPRRLTYHPYDDLVRGWTPDGRQVLFSSPKESISLKCPRLFTVHLDGGLPTPLPAPMADRGAISPDGRLLAYTPHREAFWSWKRYRGGLTAPIWVLDLATHDHVEVPHANATDTFPCWIGSTLYFLSDRQHTVNLFRWSAGQAVEQVTFHADFDVRSLTAGAGRLAYEQGGRLFLYDPDSGRSTALSLSVAADLPAIRPHFQKAAPFIQNCALSPTGQRAVFEARGDIFTVPAKKGEIRNLTRTPGVAERDPAWSPDGRSIAYFSDASGEYDLVISDQKGVTRTTITLGMRTFFYSPLWSPDSQKIAFTDKALNLYYLDVESQALHRVDSDLFDHPERTLNPAWSPDSRWLAYTRRLNNQLRAVFLHDLQGARSIQVTDGMSDATDACFSRDGKYLFFAASSDYGLNTGWLDMSSFDRTVTRSLYVLVLSRDEPSPLAPESDDEQPPAAQQAPSAPAEKPAEGTADNAPPAVKIDLEGMAQRILALPIPAANYRRLLAAEGRLFFMELLPNQAVTSESVNLLHCLKAYDFKERKADVFVDKLVSYWVSADGRKLLYRAEGQKFAIVGADKRPEPGDGALALDAMEIAVDPRAEWRQMFREGYRLHRDYFYDPEYHGLDLEAAYRKYLPFLEHVGHRDDLNYLLAEFSGELVVGHAYVGFGDIPAPEPVSVGLLGADYAVDQDRYRIRRIYAGLNWRPELRSPLTEPGVNVNEGDYILAVNGQPLHASANLFSAFAKTADRITDLLISPTPNEADGRVVSVRPIPNEIALRLWCWVEDDRRRVESLSKGRVAYVYMPDTALDGYASFNRYYFSQLDKEALVLDERFNSGGSVADYVIDLLSRSVLSYWATREGRTIASPNAAIFGPKVMIINEMAGSGGDALPQFFRRRGLGKLVGKRTWGGLIGIYDYPPLMDGGFFSSPRIAIFSPAGEWEVENEGVAPDIEVVMTPKQVIDGHDPQLEAALAVVLAELEADPPPKIARPAPVRRATAADS
jgi:tricorn protease